MAGDVSHLVSIFLLIHSISTIKSVDGLSLKSQYLYLLVFATRYTDLFYKFVSIYNTFMKIFFLGSSIYTIHLMKRKYRSASTQKIDTFKIEYLIGGSLVLALITTFSYTVTEVLWAFSLWLESVSILPQLFVLQRAQTAQTLTTHYIFALGLYRTLYIFNWFYRWFAEGRFDWLSVLTGFIQTLIYSDFFWIYYTRVMKGLNFELPV